MTFKLSLDSPRKQMKPYDTFNHDAGPSDWIVLRLEQYDILKAFLSSFDYPSLIMEDYYAKFILHTT